MRCGSRQRLHSGQVRPGDRVEVVPASPGEKTWSRWEIAAIDYQSAAAEASDQERRGPLSWTVKRIWGLPGERIEFEDGELLVDGQLVRKNWEQQCALRVLVDADGASARGLDSLRRQGNTAQDEPALLEQRGESASGWHPVAVADTNSWQRTPRGWKHGVSMQPDDQRDQEGVLEYRHRRCIVGSESSETLSGSVTAAAPIEDLIAFDPFRPRRLYPVGGVMWEALVRLGESSSLRIEIHDGVQWVGWEWSAAGRVQVRDGERLLLEDQVELEPTGTRLGVSTISRQATWAINEREAGVITLAGRDRRPRENFLREPLRVTARCEVWLEQVRVWRDTFATSAQGEPSWSLGRALTEDEYFVMGDHFAASIDSRTSGRGARGAELMGRVARRE